jgi:hypothetical protein
MQISAQSIIEQVRFLIEHETSTQGETPRDVLRLSAVALLRQASDLLDAAEEADRGI